MITIFFKDSTKQEVLLTNNTKNSIAIIDPPYGLGESSKNHKSRNTPIIQKDGTRMSAPKSNYGGEDWDKEIPSDDFFTKIFSKTSNHIIFGANYFPMVTNKPSHKPPRRSDFDQYIKENPIGYIIWDKVNGENDFSDCEVIKTSFKFKSYVLKYMWNGMMQGKSLKEGHIQQGDKKLNEKRIHPTQKPVIIYKYLLNKYCKKDWEILDTHLGSGSIIEACLDLEFLNVTAYENSKSILNKTIERLAIFNSQFNLFSKKTSIIVRFNDGNFKTI